jgi:hypothetical protein
LLVVSFLNSYYEKKLDIDAIEHIYRHEILTTKAATKRWAWSGGE